jgi:tetratricopeptide (TPR) repeat protein
VNEWHNHNPLPGTVYNLGPRMDHPSLTDRGDVVTDFERLRQLAPADNRILEFIAKRKYNDKPTYDQAMELYHAELAYSPYAMRAVAASVYAQPALYEDLMTQAAKIDPRNYYKLGDYALRMNRPIQEDKAAQYYQTAYDADPDRVGASFYSEWLVRYWLKRNRKVKAGEIAREAGEVYSERGLTAQAVYFELTGDYDNAFEWFAKIEERYNESGPLINFCTRYKTQTGNSRFDSELKKRSAKLFPKGMEKVSLADFKNPPTDGVGFGSDSELLRQAGLKTTDVVVAVYGIRVHNMAQYSYGRNLKDTPELDLIVWQGDGYHEVKTSPPEHRFGVDLNDYAP